MTAQPGRADGGPQGTGTSIRAMLSRDRLRTAEAKALRLEGEGFGADRLAPTRPIQGVTT
jgi:hypothetical protein